MGKGKHREHRAAAPRSVGSSPPPTDPAIAAAVAANPPNPPIGAGLVVGAADLGGFGWMPWHIGVETALALGAVVRCVNVIAGAVSRMPWREWEGRTAVPASRLVERPAASMTRREWTWRVAATLALESTCYLLRTGGEDDEGVPWSLIPVPPQAIMPAELTDPWGMIPPTAYVIGSDRVSAESLVILRRTLYPGIPDHLAGVLRLARETFSAALAAESYASRYWRGGGSPVTYISGPGHISGEQAVAIAERWRDRRIMGPDYPAVLGNGAEAHAFGVDPTQAAAVDARREQVADIARYFGVPTRLVNAPASDDETYANVESEGLDLVRFCLGDYMGPIEDGITGVLPPPRRLALDPTAITRGLQGDRYQAWAIATGNRPWMLPAEVREAEHLEPLSDEELARIAEVRAAIAPPPAAPDAPADEPSPELEPVAAER